MKFKLKSILYIFPLVLLTSLSHAGVYQDKLNQCFESSVTEQERKDLTQWIFFAMASNSELSGFTRISSDELILADKKIAKIYERILTQNCNMAVKDVVKNEGTNALEKSFEYLGQLAMRGMLVDKNVNQRIGKFAQYLDESKFKKAFE
ncbi:hypothetical protein [Acinetobacter calcoaceticus]|uniref:hypothetical protein n=1 Tax=Acinetobacter calcoaceticus TaxID=471 RepID=UPI001D0DCAF2|nr:hypothetical protein [Acinetobacter calcoaceticus]